MGIPNRYHETVATEIEGSCTVSNPQPIDRKRAKEAFERYVEPYDAANPRIALKVDHTLRVADIAARIARETGFPQAGQDLAWLCGLLHDIGRFEQLRRWDTFSDRASASHAEIGVDVLFNGAAGLSAQNFGAPVTDEEVLAADAAFAEHARQAGTIRAFIEDDMADDIIRAAVGYHNAFELPDNLDVRTRAIADVVRDADKIDILRVTCTDTVKTVLGVSEDELLSSEVSEAVEDTFFEHRTVLRAERETPADYLVSLACFTYGLVYPASLQIALEQGFVFMPFERPFGIERAFTNRATAMLMGRMDGHLRAWVDERLD